MTLLIHFQCSWWKKALISFKNWKKLLPIPLFHLSCSSFPFFHIFTYISSRFLSLQIHSFLQICVRVRVCLQAALGRSDVQDHSGTSLLPSTHMWSINHCLILLLTVVQVWVAHAISPSDSQSMRFILIIAYKVIQMCFWFSIRVQCSWFFADSIWTLHPWT